MDKDLVYQIALTQIPNVGSIKAKNLVGYCGGVKEVFSKSKTFLKKAPGVGDLLADNIVNFSDFEGAEKEVEFIKRNDLKTLFFLDADYPYRLKNIPDCPIILYTRGKANLSPNRSIAIVGTRNMTEYGKRFVNKLVEDLVPYSPTVFSGLAYGVDIQAHKQCVKLGLKTVGVVAHGMDRIYPDLHVKVAREMIAKDGAIITEYPSGARPNKQHFPMRNRIVAGLVDAVIVVESAVKGGSLITAELGNQYNRDVLALPGDFGKKYSAGCNYLIKNHKANLIEGVDDLVRLLNWDLDANTTPQKELFIELSPEEEKVIGVFKDQKMLGIDKLSAQLDFTPSKLSVLLLELEMKNCLISLPGKQYQCII